MGGERSDPPGRARPTGRLAQLWKGGTAYLRGRLRGGAGRAPLAMTFLVTLDCNLRCRYCDFYDHRGRELTAAELGRAFDELARAGMVRLAVSGGEPLLREDLGEILRRAARTGAVTSLVTNGHQVALRAAELDPVDAVFVSLDGSEASHDEARGRGSFAEAERALQALASRGARVNTITVLTDDTAAHIDEPLRRAAEVGGRAFFQPVFSWPWNDTQHGCSTPVLAALRRLERRKRAGAPVGNSWAYLARARRDPARPLALEHCAAGRWMATVLPDGRMIPCCSVGDWDRFPRATPGRFRETFERLGPPPACPGCAISPYVETSLMFRLHPGVVLNAVGLLAPGRRG